MKQSLMAGPFPLQIISFLIFSGCFASHNKSSLANDSVNQATVCFDGSFQFNGQKILLKELIGEGSYGKVYKVADDQGQEFDDLVAKLIYDASDDIVTEHLKEELFLSRAFPDHYTPTAIASQLRFKNKFGEDRALGILLKQRIEGETLQNIVGTNASKFLDTEGKVISAFQSLDRFKDSLIKKMMQRASKNIYLGDLHPRNLMYDGAQWHIVDAQSLDSRSALAAYLEQPGFDDMLTFGLIAELESLDTKLDTQFFNALIDAQLGDAYRELVARYKKARESSSSFN